MNLSLLWRGNCQQLTYVILSDTSDFELHKDHKNDNVIILKDEFCSIMYNCVRNANRHVTVKELH